MTDIASPDLPEITSEDFDHIEEAKDAIADVVNSGRLDFTSAIAVAQTHALISIAQSLDALAFQSEADDLDLTSLGITITGETKASYVNPVGTYAVHHAAPHVPNDYYREG